MNIKLINKKIYITILILILMLILIMNKNIYKKINDMFNIVKYFILYFYKFC